MKNISMLILALSVLIFLNNCSDDTHSPADHFDPEGWVFIDETGARFMQIYQGKFKSGSDEEFIVPYENDTDHYKIKFLDKNGKEIDPPTSEDYTLSWEIKDGSKLKLEQHDGEEWEFHLEGLKLGETEIQFHVYHDGHSDVRSGFIKVKVEDVD
ncbi:MAG: hypothetical protein M9949_05490 [Candidatus Kapabacteria bacterium]|nr:hypothetical protein [Candidatus Kapabacteria bacterium]